MDEPNSLDSKSITTTPNAALAGKPTGADPSLDGGAVDRTVVSQAPIASPNEFYANGTVASLAKVLIGQSLDHYLLHDLVGGGGMGAVFRASDTRLDREVAVKVIPNLGRDLESMRRFQVEAQSAAKLDHPHIARVYYVGETEAWSYIVFEYVEGTNLRDLVIRDGPLTVDDAVCYTVQVADALQHASERSVVHRDIKPSNVLVTPEGFIKVVDMGLARTTSFDRPNQDLTVSGVTLGTFDYISPEQASNPRAADVRSDLYSLGCTLYYFLTGRPPFADGNAFQKLLMHGSVEPADPSLFRDDLPPDLVAIIRKLMAKRPDDRYQTPEDLIIDLRLLANFEHLSKSQNLSGLTVAPATAMRSRVDVMLPWLGGVLLVLISTAYLYFHHRVAMSFEIPQLVEASEEWLEEQALRRQNRVEPMRSEEKLSESIGGSTNGVPENPSETSEITSNPITGFSPPFTPKLDDSDEVTAARILWLRPFADGSSRLMPEDGQDYRLIAGSLSDAIMQAEADPQIEAIWLDDDVWSIDQPITIKRSSLILKSAPHCLARIEVRIPRDVFASTNAANASETMHGIAVGTNHLIVEDVELVVYPPPSSRGRLNLFELSSGGAIHLLHSTLTLMPNGGDWQVAAFGCPNEAMNPAEPSSSSSSLVAKRDPIEVSLEDCIVRGEGDFMAFETGRRAEIEWKNGLLCVSGRLLETAGATETSRTPPTIRMHLSDVTVAAESGFARMRLRPNAAFPVCLSRTAINCAFWNRAGLPVIALENLPKFEDSREAESPSDWLAEWIDLRGADNAYDSEIGPLVQLKSEQGQMEHIDFESRSAGFFAERAPETTVRWIGRLPSITPLEQQTAGDYLQKDKGFRPGFRPELLPNH
jgi:serine/threonine protein kinase